MELGFLFHSPENSQAIGHPQLDANLYEIPTGEHFDPYQLTLPVETENEGVKNTSFYHPADPGSYRVGVGRIILADQEEKEIEAFIFGGELEISVFPERSFCQIRSSAPIFYVNRFAEDELGLVNEYEGELARLRAAWKHATPDFDQRLAQIDPKTLFIAFGFGTLGGLAQAAFEFGPFVVVALLLLLAGLAARRHGPAPHPGRSAPPPLAPG